MIIEDTNEGFNKWRHNPVYWKTQYYKDEILKINQNPIALFVKLDQ